MTVKEFMRTYYRVTMWPGDVPWYRDDKILSVMRPRIVCNDGFSISVQASKNHYCEPRENLLALSIPYQDYSEVELGYPSEADELIEDYAEDPEDLTQTVYGWVPIELVEELITKHGGIKGYDEEHAARLKENVAGNTTFSW